jgi:hypothetical protein
MGDVPESDRPATSPADEPPPFLGRWSRLYALVLVLLAVEIALFWAFTQAFH